MCGHKACTTLHYPVALGGFDAVVSKFGVFLNTGERNKLQNNRDFQYFLYFQPKMRAHRCCKERKLIVRKHEICSFKPVDPTIPQWKPKKLNIYTPAALFQVNMIIGSHDY